MNTEREREQLRRMSAEELAQRAQGGCRRSFSELVGRLGPRLFHYLRGRTPTVQDAEDLVQDTFVRAYRQLHRYDAGVCKFSTWLFVIGYRLAINMYRQRQKQYAIHAYGAVRRAPTPCEVLAGREENDNLWILARSLPEKQYDALYLRYAEELSIVEIAEVLQTTRVNVKVLLHRARTRLARLHERSAAERMVRKASIKRVVSG